MAKEELQNPAPSKSSGSKKIIIFAGVGVLVAGIVVAVAVFLAGGSSPNEAAAAERSEQAEQKRPALYFSLSPAFIVNFQNKESRARFLKLELDGVTREARVVEAVKAHMPMIRNNLVLLFSKQVYEDIASYEGKEKLRAEALAEIQKVLEKETGNTGVEEVLFTSLVMQ